MALITVIAWSASATADFPASINRKGEGTVKIAFEQWPKTYELKNWSGKPGECAVNIPFRGLFSSKLDGAVYWRAVHSDGAISKDQASVDLPTPASGRNFSYTWSKSIPPNKPFSGWVMIEARNAAHGATVDYKYKSSKAHFTIKCNPEGDKWTAPPPQSFDEKEAACLATVPVWLEMDAPGVQGAQQAAKVTAVKEKQKIQFPVTHSKAVFKTSVQCGYVMEQVSVNYSFECKNGRPAGKPHHYFCKK